MILDYLKISVNSLRRRKIRSWLTILGIFIGIAAVVGLISLSEGMQRAITEEFEKLGSDRITITPGGQFFGPMGAGMTTGKLTEDDADLIESVAGVEIAAGVLSETARVEFNKEVKFITVYGMLTDTGTAKYIEDISFFEIETGRQLKPADRYSAIAGNNIAKDSFEKEIKTGNKILIEETEFDVVGVQKKAGTGVHDVIIRIPLSVARTLFDEPDEFSMIFVKTKKGAEPSEVGDRIKEKMRKGRGLDRGEEDFSVQTAEQIIGTFKNILLMMQALLIGIAAISLVVGGIGIMNTMYTSVLERTSEIGLMKAVGAENKDIMLLFMIESGMIGVAGGVVGIIIGIGISKLVELIAVAQGLILLKIGINPILIIGALLFSFIVGAISGTAPAIRAARLKPVEALKKK